MFVEEVEEQAAQPTEERDPAMCYGIVGTSVWYCRDCERVLSSPITPHLKPLPKMPVESVPVRPNRAMRRAS